MKLVRTFHPVGHGAFYTERFYKRDEVKRENCVFTAVYDCGGSPVGGLEKYVRKNIKETTILNSNDRIDVLFVSHFHMDHISGIQYLLKYCDKIVLPVLTESLLLEGAIHNAGIRKNEKDDDADVNQFLYDIYLKEGIYDEHKMVFVEEASEDYRDGFEGTIIEETRGNVGCRVAFRSSKLNNWIFIPYNLKKGPIKKKIEDFFKKEKVIKSDGKIDIQKLKTVLKRGNLKKVQDVYKKDRKEDTNYHSMTVYSGHEDYSLFPSCKCCCCNHDCCCCLDINCGKCNDLNANPHCLFMGDYPANKNNIEKLVGHYRRYWLCSGTVQVPHHGSDKVTGPYGTDLFYRCRLGVLSVKFGKHNGVPSSNVIKELINHNVSPVYVTDDIRTKLIKTYSV